MRYHIPGGPTKTDREIARFITLHWWWLVPLWLLIGSLIVWVSPNGVPAGENCAMYGRQILCEGIKDPPERDCRPAGRAIMCIPNETEAE